MGNRIRAVGAEPRPSDARMPEESATSSTVTPHTGATVVVDVVPLPVLVVLVASVAVVLVDEPASSPPERATRTAERSARKREVRMLREDTRATVVRDRIAVGLGLG